MPEGAPPPPAGPRPARRFGPLTGGQWLMVAGGLVAAWLVYRWYENREASNAATAAEEAAQDTEAVPASVGAGTTTVGTSATGTATPATLAAWIQQAIADSTNATYSPSQAFNDIMSWLSGNDVSQQGYSAIGQAIETLGLPPGYATAPILTVSPSAASTTSTSTTSSGSSTTTSTTPTQTTPLTALQQAIEAGINWFGTEGTNTVIRGPQGLFVGLTTPQEAASYAAAGQTLYTYSAATNTVAPLSSNQANTVPGEFVQTSSQPYGGVTV